MSLLKNLIGKDLTSFQFPVSFSEPISLLQRMLELGNHYNILQEATFLDNKLERLAYVTGYFMTFFAWHIRRVNKPFNPLLGETFEIQGNDWRGVAE